MSISDMGGTTGHGPVPRPDPREPPFVETWEGRAFALTALIMGRVSGQNLDAFRYALARLSAEDYLADGYYGRWLNAAERMLVESRVLAPDAVNARVAARAGHDVDQPAFPTPQRPEYQATAPGSLRHLDASPRFAPGDAVRTRSGPPAGPSKLPGYLSDHRGLVRAVRPPHVLPDTHAVFAGENAQYVYTVAFTSTELWGADDAETGEGFRLHADLFDSYLEEDR